MVVDWTGSKPDREGYWLVLFHFNESNTDTPMLLDVYPNEDNPDELIAYVVHERCAYMVDDLFSDRVVPTDTLGCKPFIFDTQDYSIRCATAPIQYNNIDWDYKLTGE